jgi:hypothetical protein
MPPQWLTSQQASIKAVEVLWADSCMDLIQAIKGPEQIYIAVKVKTAFQIQKSSYFAFLIYALYIRSCKCKLDDRIISCDLV